jgi:putative PIN family toxin of toxin-antitoxin system
VRAVVDTNVLISGLLWRGAPHTLIEMARAGVFDLISSPMLLVELERVMRRPKFQIVFAKSRTSPRQMLREVGRLIEIVEAPPLGVPVSRDPDDDHVLAVAVAGKAGLIISGDHDLLSLGAHMGIDIVTPLEAVRLFVKT